MIKMIVFQRAGTARQLTPTFFFLLLFIPFSLLSQDSIDAFISNQMQQQRIIGLSLGIIRDGKIVKSAGYGKANIELNVPVSEKTVFKIASLSKQFIATGILKLIHEGKLTLDTPLRTIIKNIPDAWKLITIRHLLNHTSGLPEEPPGFDGMKQLPDSVYIMRAFKRKPDFKPGTKFQYSNVGYFVLADIIRIVAHKSFSDYIGENIFIPAGMNNTRVTSTESIIDNRASGYVEDPGKQIKNASNYIAVRPSGAFLSNITDLLKWEQVMQERRLFDYNESDTAMTEALKTALTMDNEPIYYRYGLMINKVGNQHLAHHGGSLPGFKSVYLRYLEDRSAIIILTNSDQTDAYAIAFGIADLLRK